MPYRKRNVPGDPKELPAFLNQEFSNLEEAQYGPFPFWALDVLHAEPRVATDARRAVFAVADGTDWNPGSGAGLYRKQGGSWVFVG